MADHVKKKVWDLPTRLCHWALVACVLGLAVTGLTGGGLMAWHFRLGYAVLSLLLFRLVWGFAGGHWSRFHTFLYSPAAVLRYAKGSSQGEPSAGHNPMGAISVFAILGFLAMQVGSGLFSDDEIASAGPLSKFVSEHSVSLATRYHKDFGKYILLALLLLHVAAVVFYLLRKRQNLIAPMLNGHKVLPREVPASRDDAKSRAIATLTFAACAGCVGLLVSFAG
jgi:cytochrome b